MKKVLCALMLGGLMVLPACWKAKEEAPVTTEQPAAPVEQPAAPAEQPAQPENPAEEPGKI